MKLLILLFFLSLRLYIYAQDTVSRIDRDSNIESMFFPSDNTPIIPIPQFKYFEALTPIGGKWNLAIFGYKPDTVVSQNGISLVGLTPRQMKSRFYDALLSYNVSVGDSVYAAIASLPIEIRLKIKAKETNFRGVIIYANANNKIEKTKLILRNLDNMLMSEDDLLVIYKSVMEVTYPFRLPSSYMNYKKEDLIGSLKIVMPLSGSAVKNWEKYEKN